MGTKTTAIATRIRIIVSPTARRQDRRTVVLDVEGAVKDVLQVRLTFVPSGP